MLFVLAWVGAVVDALCSGGWWVVLGWTVVSLTLIVLVARAFKHAPGAQHQGGSNEAEQRGERLQYADRR
jgi:membrane protein implicated in regulation of membrane protease activity